MKHCLVIMLALGAFVACTARAAFLNDADDYVLARNVTLRGETWLKARTVTVLGDTEDDIFVMSDLGASMATTNVVPSVRLSGVLVGDVWALGDDVELSGMALSHARLAGLRTVRVTGSVGRNIMALANSVHIAASSTVTGDVSIAAVTVIAEGVVGGNVTIHAQKAVLGGRIAGDVTLKANDITVLPGTEIGGSLAYFGPDDLFLDPRVKVAGKLTHLRPPPTEAPRITLDGLVVQMGLFLGALLAALLLFSTLPAFAFHSVERLGQSIWRSLLIGFVACALIPMAAGLLILTMVGIPLGVMLLLVYVLLLYFAKAISAFYVAHRAISRFAPARPVALMPMLGLGLLLIYITTNLPFPLDAVAWVTFTLMGVGGMVGAIFDRRMQVLAVQGDGSDRQPPPPPPPPLAGGGE